MEACKGTCLSERLFSGKIEFLKWGIWFQFYASSCKNTFFLLTRTMQISNKNSTIMCDEDEPKAKKKKREEPTELFLATNTNHWSLLQRCEEKCLDFTSCYHTRLLEWLLNVGEKVVPPENCLDYDFCCTPL